uniref:Uncharacterized protein n=1 Tax=Panagrolaimus davidi TaxID=227884 RepID=A0A914QYB7_9BILA
MFEYFTVIFSSIHPAVYERILKHHLPYFMHRSTVSFSIQQLLLHILSTPLVIPTNMILFDYICENMDILFLYDDDDKHRVDFFSKLIRLILTHVMQNLRTEPLLKDYISKIQAFFYKLITKTVHYIVRMYDASHLQAMLKTILRICGSPQAEQFYKLFLPMFPSFLHWFSALQNILSPEALQEYFIELCLSLPARLSSLVPYMSLLADPEINSFQNPLLLSQQGLRAIELCLDNYSAIHVRDFFGPSGIARLNESLWTFISTSMDHQLSLQCLKILGKLSCLNRNSLCDIQKLSFTSTESKSDKPSIVVYFERSGKSTDDFITNQQLTPCKPSGNLNEVIYVQDSRNKMYTLEKHVIETKPLQCNLLLRPILSHCVNILKNSLLTERNFTNINRSDSVWLLLTWIKSAFDSYGAKVDKNEFISRILVINKDIMALSKTNLNGFNVSFASEIPYRSEMSSARQMLIDCIIGLSYAAANGDVKDDIEAHWEELIDFLTLQLHLETSIQYFGGILSISGVYPVSMDAFVLIDAIIAILCEPHSRFHACAIYTLLRMIQTSRSFASTSEEAQNIPLFHFLVQEISQLCTHPEPCHRLGGIYLLEIIIENFPTNFLFASFETLITAALDVLHFGDDDISQTSQESAMEVGKKLIDKVFEQKSEDLYKYLAALVLKHSKSCSFWTNKLLCEILIYLQAQTSVSPLELFSASDVQEFYKQHEIEFMNSKMEFRYLQLVSLLHSS